MLEIRGENLTSQSDPIPIVGVMIWFQNDSWSTFYIFYIYISLDFKC